MFNWLFGKKKTKPVLSKLDYWKAFELYELFDDLDGVIAVLEHNDTRVDFIAFKESFTEELGELEGANDPDFSRIWEWFAPGSDWDRLMARRGFELGKAIFKRADRWKRNQEFLPNSIVSLGGEYGVVLNDAPDRLYGLVRWDTDKAQDTEDWRGLWGTFVTMGGKVLEEYDFKFIMPDSSIKLNMGTGTENRDFEALKEEVTWFLRPGSQVSFKEKDLRLSEEFASVFPVLAALLGNVRATYLEIDGADHLLLAWDNSNGSVRGWLNRLEDPQGYPYGLLAEHELLLRNIGGMKENFNLFSESLSDNQEWMFLGSECSMGLGDYEGYYEMMCEDAGFDHIDSSDYLVFAEEANGARTMYDRKDGKVYLFSHDHSFENVRFQPGQPEYTFHTINGVKTFVDYVEELAGQWGRDD